MPASLIGEINDIALAEDISVDACLLHHLKIGLKIDSTLPEFAYAWTIATEFHAHRNSGKWRRQQCIDALCEVAEYLDASGAELFRKDNMSSWDIMLAGNPTYRKIKEKYKPHQK